MITLPTHYTNGLLTSGSVVFFVDISMLDNGVQKHLYTSNYPSGSMPGMCLFNYSGSVVVQQDQYLAGKIINQGQVQSVDGIGEVDFALDCAAGGGVSSINTLSIILLNQGSFVNSHSYDFENQAVKVFKTIGTGSIVVETDMVPVFIGNITNAYSYDATQFKIDCVDRRAVDDKMMPSYYLDSATNVPHLDQNASNKFIPIVLGDFLTPDLTPVTASILPFVFGKLSAAPTIISDIYQGQSLVSDSQFSVSGSIYITDDSSKFITVVQASQYSTSTGSIGTNFIPAGRVNSLIVNPNYGELWTRPSAQGYHPDIFHPPGRTDTTWEVNTSTPSTSYIQDFGNAVDGDITTSVTIPSSAAQAPGLVFMQLQLPSFTEPGTLINKNDPNYPYATNIDFYLGGVFEHQGGVVTGAGVNGDFMLGLLHPNTPFTANTRIGFPGAPSNGMFTYEWGLQGGDNTGVNGINDPSLTNMTWDLLKSLYFGFGPTGRAGFSPSKLLIVHHLWIRARTRFENSGIARSVTAVPQYGQIFDTDLRSKTFMTSHIGPTGKTDYEVRGHGISNLFVPAQGPRFTTAMTRSNGHTTADLIQDPASAIEWLLRTKLGLPTSAIATGSIDVLNNTTNGLRKDWKLATSFLERKPVLEYVSQICDDFHMTLFVTQAGQYKLVANDSVATGSIAYTVTAQDIFFDGYPQIAVSTTDNNTIQNDLSLQWGFDYTRSKTLQSVYISDINFDGVLENNVSGSVAALRDSTYTGWLQDSINRYGTRHQNTFNSTLIQDQATAQRSLLKYCDWLAFKRLKVTMQVVPNLNTQRLEIGDIIKINSDYLTSIYSNTAQFMIQSITVPPVNSVQAAYFTITALELPSANTGTPIFTRTLISSDDLVSGH